MCLASLEEEYVSLKPFYVVAGSLILVQHPEFSVTLRLVMRSVRSIVAAMVTAMVLEQSLATWTKLGTDGPWTPREGLMGVSTAAGIFMSGGRSGHGAAFRCGSKDYVICGLVRIPPADSDNLLLCTTARNKHPWPRTPQLEHIHMMLCGSHQVVGSHFKRWHRADHRQWPCPHSALCTLPTLNRCWHLGTRLGASSSP
jgi:hypothetical protein